VSGVVIHLPELPGEGRWDPGPLVSLRRRVEAFGIKVESIENTPWEWYDHAMLGEVGADEQIENYCYSIRSLGEAGIPVLGFCWMPSSVWTTAVDTPSRGGALVRSFDLDLVDSSLTTHGRQFSDDDMWLSFEHFIQRVLPVAEEAGVRLALHPDDPPVATLGGIARIFRDMSAFRRAIDIADSPNFGLNFCMGTWSEMGPIVPEALSYFGERKKIVYVHFRDVKGHVPKFQECFLGEGNVNVVQAVTLLKRAGFDGCMENDHVPIMLGEDGWAPLSRAYATGYIAGLVRAVEQLA
jgi:mannonate dehydratase